MVRADVALVGGTVYTMTDADPREGATVLIAGGRVQAVGADLAVPPGFERVDARGRIVTPGLIESYSQLGLEEISGEASTNDDAVSGFRLGPDFDIRYAINPASTLLPVNRVEGITRAVVAPQAGNDPLAGWGAAIRLGGDDILTRTEVALFGSVTQGSAGFVGGSRSAVVQRLRGAFKEAARFNAGRYRPDDEDYRRRDMAALKRFLGARVPLVLEVNRANEIRQVVALAAELGVEPVILGGAEAWQAADALAAARVPVIVDVLANLPLSYDQLGARIDNAVLLHRAGVPVLFTSEETHNARWLRHVAGNAVAEGMPWLAALAAITREPARVFGLGEGVGTLAPGAPADLVVWSGDPLEVTTWAERVMINGRWIPMRSRQTRLYERYQTLDGDEPFGYR